VWRGKLLSHSPLFLWRRSWTCSYRNSCLLCWNAMELPHTRTEWSWNWALEHVAPARWCNCPYSETIHRGRLGNISGARHFITLRTSMACMLACDYFLWGYLKAKMYTTRPRTIDDLKIAIRKQISAIPENMARRALRNCEQSWKSVWCAIQNEISRDVMKCMWNKVTLNINSFCHK
jgi:hypothetical protein